MTSLVDKAVAYLTSAIALRHYGTLAAIFLITLLLDMLARRSISRYRSKGAANDFGYFAFYYFGPFQILMIPVFLPLAALIRHYAPWLQLNLISNLPLIPRLVAFILISDLLGYWLHRVIHGVPSLWAFHKVHHSQEAMTVLTNYRRHPVDEGVMRFVSFFVFVITGNAVMTWALLDICVNLLLLLQHSGFNWTYGKLEKVLISPRMHGLHHSTDSAHFNRNYGMLLSIWDEMFGTALARGNVVATGVEPPMPESLWRQFIDPFREVLHRRRRTPNVPPVIAAEPGSAA